MCYSSDNLQIGSFNCDFLHSIYFYAWKDCEQLYPLKRSIKAEAAIKAFPVLGQVPLKLDGILTRKFMILKEKFN